MHLGDRTYSATKFLLAASGDEPARLAAVGVDVTEHLRIMQKAFYAAQEDFRHAFNYAPLGVALADMETRFTKVNPAMCALLGYDEELLLSSSLRSGGSGVAPARRRGEDARPRAALNGPRRARRSA